MKKLLGGLLLLFSMIIYILPVHADVIWEPEDNFLSEHLEESVYVDREYIAAGADGVTKIYKSPQNGAVVSTVENGGAIYIGYTWNEWLYSYDGWIHSDDVSLPYDSTQFHQDNALTEYDGGEISIPKAQLYTYPNSGVSYELIEVEDYLLIGAAFSSAYTDEDGLQWGYINYYMQHEGWVCIDDPTNSNLNSGIVPLEQSVSQKRGSDAVVEKASNIILPVATILVVAVVIITLLLLLKKKSVK